MQTNNRPARFFRAFRHAETGAALIELALVFPILVLLAMGVADYARVYLTSIVVANAAMAGAQYGSFDAANAVKNDEIIQRARDDAGDPTLSVTPSSVCRCTTGGPEVPCADACGTYADGLPQLYVRVDVTKDVSLFIHYLGLPETVTVRDSATYRAR